MVLGRLRRRPLLASASILVVASASAIAYESSKRPFPTIEGPLGFAHAIHRSTRAVYAFTVNSIDYKFSLRHYDKKTEEYYSVLSEVHLRAAKRILKVCDANKGFYTKAGQFIASLQQFPKEYVETLQVLQDQAQFWPYKAIERVFLEEFGRTPRDIFLNFEEIPLAAASLAQVHRAWLNEKEEVAVKVQYPGLQRQFEIDIFTMAVLSKWIAWVFPDYRFEWIVPEFEKNILKELDFRQEARNAETTAANFVHKKEVRIPSIYWGCTTSRILTMEFLHGIKIDDVESLVKAGIDPKQVSRVLLEVFAEMIFCNGLVHGDPHPGNVLVSLSPSRRNKYNFELVLLDHGLYRELDEDFRLDFCRLWRAMIFSNIPEMEYTGLKLGAGEFYRFLPVILTGRTLDSKSSLATGMTPEERARLKEEVRKFSMGDISTFMEGLSSDFLIVLRTDGLLRTIANKHGAPRTLRLQMYARYALLGRAMYIRGKPGVQEQGVANYAQGFLENAYLRFRLGVLECLFRAEEIYTALVEYVYRMLLPYFSVVKLKQSS